MWASGVRQMPRLPSSYLDYARHMPKAYVERMKRTVPKKVFTDRFGAPDIVRWTLHPDDYVPGFERPWTDKELAKNMKRADAYFSKKVGNKFFILRREASKRLADNEWTILVGDRVQVMVGKDVGKQRTVLAVNRDTSEVLVDGCHTKLVEEGEGSEKFGLGKVMRWAEQPLSLRNGHVQLVDPNDEQPCTARWRLNDAGDEYIRVSERSGYSIPIPAQALVTYEYLQPDKYLEVSGKDTPSAVVLERTYRPRLATFQEEIMNEMNIKDEGERKPSYWY